MTSTNWKKRILYGAVCAFVCAGTAAISVFMAVIVPSQYARETRQYAAALGAAQTGDSVWFGAYEQDNNPGNGKEPIEWIVLSADGERRLLVSRYALDCQCFSEAVSMATWDYSTILTWLNNDFYEDAFTGAEQTMVLTSDVKPDRNPVFLTDAGGPTSEKVFLLSISEAYRYLRSEKARQCQPTTYAAAKGARTDGDNCTWWLRSPGYDASVATRVLASGKINYCGYPVSGSANSVRPCIWVETA